MRKVALIAASVVALGWATAQAQTSVDVDVGSESGSTTGTGAMDPALPAPSTTSPSRSTTTPGTTITTPGATVTTPPASNVNVDTGAPGSTNIEVTPAPSTTTTSPSTTSPSTTTTTPSTPGTSVDINTPGAGGVNVQTPPGTDTDVDVNVPAAPSATVPESSGAAATGGVTEPEMGAAPAPVAPVAPAPYAAIPVDTGEEATGRYGSRLGAGLLVGGGFEDFTGSNARSITGYGGNWNARLILGARQFLGIEAAYVGSARNIDALGLQNDAVLVSNGAEGALRLNIPVVYDQGRGLVAPFGFVGLGWQRYDVTNSSTATSNLNDRDDVMTMPVGGGLALGYGAFMADVRGTYRETWRNDLLRTAQGGKLNTWGVSGQVGFIF